mmetsp:Transcript_25578/g.65037  ORF Transcript_25578/g.65037 Transcript_25578/m.65037 type:complete len:1155 (-) Transcript_25578:286-3750(-)|eukprot:CAMPEP_0174925474 /NCGR_PEP_ID=MMETSP1355-20121228/7943_1 /TAXON_ID=464990 /ORGANISM="Hemiselmis tepida, Strain CCMP443" /LENGTH=1154 /DNA_ID=CAMNT_0016171399 /DNA_START=140 /DNA_END=3604 /DNA_ORIENTATION=-
MVCRRLRWYTKGFRAPLAVLFCLVLVLVVWPLDLDRFSLVDWFLPLQISNFPPRTPLHGVAIIGASGYIGSRLAHHLSSVNRIGTVHSKGYFRVVGYDPINLKRIKDASPTFHRVRSSDISSTELRSFETVVYLAGCTGRATCREMGAESAHRENVDDIMALVKRMAANQTLIFASTSALAEGSGSVAASENFPVRLALLDEYSFSMAARERALAAFSASHTKPRHLKIIGLRFGTVVGVSPGQRTDLSAMAMIKAAFTTGEIRVTHPEVNRSFLWLEDLVRAIERIITVPVPLGQTDFEVYNIASFDASISALANTVSFVTGARILAVDHGNQSDIAGFTLNVTKFQRTFQFRFNGSLHDAIVQLSENVPESIIAKGAHSVRVSVPTNSIPCPVCGSQHLQEVLNLGSQPLANDFRSTAEESVKCPQFPLKLMRCRSCNHVHLSTVVDRSSLFTEYLYESGTSQTLKLHFKWLANKIMNESISGMTHGRTVLEIACNDGSQLDHFKATGVGWRTFCVDPAANIVKKAAEKGHNVVVGFLGTDDVSSKLPPFFDAIVAQNVFAHVSNPVSFLRACKAKMGTKTRLYLQTSQCQMMHDGQFDTAYHEHISFFSAHSFQRAAELAGLQIIEFDTVPIHGISCLVTMMLPGTATPRSGHSLQVRLKQEQDFGMNGDFFYMKFAAQALFLRDWVRNHVLSLKKGNYTLVMYGAAAKGMVLLNFLARDVAMVDVQFLSHIDFVVDDAQLKQNRFCPGTRIPVKPTSYLRNYRESHMKIGIVVLAWNFWAEIKARIIKELQSDTEVDHARLVLPVLIPFPTARVVLLDVRDGSERVVANLPVSPTSLAKPLQPHRTVAEGHLRNPTYENSSLHRPDFAVGISLRPRRRVLLITHIYNEEFMLPYFIRHHSAMFDHAIIIDFNSTDSSLYVIAKEAPSSWTVVSARNPKEFAAAEVDQEVASWEVQHVNDWKITLTVTEFLVAPIFRNLLQELDDSGAVPRQFVTGIKDFRVWGNDSPKLLRFAQLGSQRALINPLFGIRYLHVGLNRGDYNYTPGRHSIDLKGGKQGSIQPQFQKIFIMKFHWSPWPEMAQRKLQIGPRIPARDKKRGWGAHHYSATSLKVLNAMRARDILSGNVNDMKNVSFPSYETYQQVFNPSDMCY